MAIPKHDEIRVPVLKLLKDNGTLKLKAIEKPLAAYFKLSDEEKIRMYSSGNGPIFYDRITWALSYLRMAGLVSKPKRAVYEISPKGIELLKTPAKIDTYISEQVNKRVSIRKEKNKEAELEQGLSDELTPQELLNASFEEIKQTTYNEIIDTILSKSPLEFERLVVNLLQSMGYGGEIEDSGIVTQATNDAGIDGIIKEDVLGFGRIYIQAKRYARENSVGRKEIQEFVGALAVAQSTKGVFITTSSFTKNAIQYVDNLNVSTTIVLIDGEELAKFIYDFGLGMQIEQTVEIKKLDSDFWDKMQDETS